MSAGTVNVVARTTLSCFAATGAELTGGCATGLPSGAPSATQRRNRPIWLGVSDSPPLGIRIFASLDSIRRMSSLASGLLVTTIPVLPRTTAAKESRASPPDTETTFTAAWLWHPVHCAVSSGFNVGVVWS